MDARLKFEETTEVRSISENYHSLPPAVAPYGSQLEGDSNITTVNQSQQNANIEEDPHDYHDRSTEGYAYDQTHSIYESSPLYYNPSERTQQLSSEYLRPSPGEIPRRAHPTTLNNTLTNSEGFTHHSEYSQAIHPAGRSSPSNPHSIPSIASYFPLISTGDPSSQCLRVTEDIDIDKLPPSSHVLSNAHALSSSSITGNGNPPKTRRPRQETLRAIKQYIEVFRVNPFTSGSKHDDRLLKRGGPPPFLTPNVGLPLLCAFQAIVPPLSPRRMTFFDSTPQEDDDERGALHERSESPTFPYVTIQDEAGSDRNHTRWLVEPTRAPCTPERVVERSYGTAGAERVPAVKPEPHEHPFPQQIQLPSVMPLAASLLPSRREADGIVAGSFEYRSALRYPGLTNATEQGSACRPTVIQWQEPFTSETAHAANPPFYPGNPLQATPYRNSGVVGGPVLSRPETNFLGDSEISTGLGLLSSAATQNQYLQNNGGMSDSYHDPSLGIPTGGGSDALTFERASYVPHWPPGYTIPTQLSRANHDENGDSFRSFRFVEHRNPATVVIPPAQQPQHLKDYANDNERHGVLRPSLAKALRASIVSAPNRAHKCEICFKGFERPSSLQTHMVVHSGEKPWQCTVPTCLRLFSVRSNLRRHLRKHGIDTRGEATDPNNGKHAPPGVIRQDRDRDRRGRRIGPIFSSGSTSNTSSGSDSDVSTSLVARPPAPSRTFNNLPLVTPPRKLGRSGESPPPNAPYGDPSHSFTPEHSKWVPESLRHVMNVEKLSSRPPFDNGSFSPVPVPLPPVRPHRISDIHYEERDSYAPNIGDHPYHPNDWARRNILPGPGLRDVDEMMNNTTYARRLLFSPSVVLSN